MEVSGTVEKESVVDSMLESDPASKRVSIESGLRGGEALLDGESSKSVKVETDPKDEEPEEVNDYKENHGPHEGEHLILNVSSHPDNNISYLEQHSSPS